VSGSDVQPEDLNRDVRSRSYTTLRDSPRQRKRDSATGELLHKGGADACRLV
jgi:hypothetical protein